jgi:hypothetical protein
MITATDIVTQKNDEDAWRNSLLNPVKVLLYHLFLACQHTKC